MHKQYHQYSRKNIDTSRDLVPFIHFKNKIHPFKSVTFTKKTLLHGVFHVFLIAQMVGNRAKDRTYTNNRTRGIFRSLSII